MTLYAIKPRFRAALRGVSAWLAGRGVTADQVTAAGVAAAALGAVALWTGPVWLVPVCALLRISANAVDGLVAEHTRTRRPAGELWNEVADRISDGLLLGGAALVPGVPPSLAVAAAGCAFLASFVGVAARAAGGARRHDGPMGKPDRMLVLSVGALTGHLVPALVVIAAGSLVTAARRYQRADANLAQRTPSHAA